MLPLETGGIKMRRQIDLGNNLFEVTLFEKSGEKLFQIGSKKPQQADLIVDESGNGTIKLGEQSTPVKLAVKGEAVFVCAFGRTFSMQIIDPVEQAVRKAGGKSGVSRALMPGTVVEINVAENDAVIKGQGMMSIESMKILTVIKAPRDGIVAQIHLELDQTFEKNTILITLAEEEK